MEEAGEPEVFLSRTKSFARRTRDLPQGLEQAFAKARAGYVLDVPRGVGYTTVAEDFRLNPEKVFGRAAPLFVEIGPGRGEQIVAFAAAHPELNFLAFEVWTPGLARLVVEAASRGLSNLKVIEADAQQALPVVLTPGSVAELWTFFPDPWRKARHHKRRLVSATFAAAAADLLQDGGVWRMATDWEDYADQMLQVLAHAPEFALADEDEDGNPTFAPRFPGRVLTHFEERGQEAGRGIWDLAAVRLPRDPQQH